MFLIRRKVHVSYSQAIAIGFALIILIGAVLLSMPISSRTKEFTPFLDALFTSASATCVTGLVVYDTYMHWSGFGQIVILMLIQTGGLGFMTVATLFSLIIKRRIGLKERLLMREAVNTLSVGGIVRMTKRILIGTFLFEAAGAFFLSFHFCRDMGLMPGIYNAVFHSISAFCNAGFDIMGRFQTSSSLTRYVGDPLVNIVIMLLIISGGVGFIVWEDIYRKRLNFHKYQLHTKIVLVTSAVLIMIPALAIYMVEISGSFHQFDPKTGILAALFQSVTSRTAGFNTVDLNALNESSQLILTLCMFIGGSPGSTSGGIKTITFAVLILSVVSIVRKKENVHAFGRNLEPGSVSKASAIAVIYLSIALTAVLVLKCAEPFSLKEIIFEVFSAAGTVGLSLGITLQLSAFGKTILILLMYFGRVGTLTIAFALSVNKNTAPIQLPTEKVMMG